jgi:hypothetical protein
LVNIANSDELKIFLFEKKILKDLENVEIDYFSSGVSGNVAYVAQGSKSLVVKQMLPKLKVAADWQCSPERISIEYKAQELCGYIMPEKVTKPIYLDKDNYIMVREAVPKSFFMWKAMLLQGVLDFGIAEKVIGALSRLHNATFKDERVHKEFEDIHVFENLRVDPYITYVVGKYPKLKRQADDVIQILREEKISLVHGDYSPKNILVNAGNIFILDFEVAHYGHPSFDVAFFTNHFILKAVKNKQWSDAYLNMLQYIVDIYFNNIQYGDKKSIEKTAIEILVFLLLARVDGKSPAEYLTEDGDIQLIRALANKMFEEEPSSYTELIHSAKTIITR